MRDWRKLPLIQKYRDIEIVRNQKDSFGLDIIIPHYNNTDGLRKTLESIDDQLVTVTVVDDCSTNAPGYEALKKDFPNVNFI